MTADISYWPLVFVIFGLLALSAFFSGSETALTATSRARIHKLEQDGVARAVAVNRLIADRERLIGAILLGNNLVNILASALATSVLLSLVGEAGIAYATIGMTALVLIFAEVLPKTYAISNPDRMAMQVAPAIRVFVVLFAPIVAAVRLIVRRTLRLAGVDVDDADNVLSAHEEIRGAIDLHHQEGGVVTSDRYMLGGILDLKDLEVNEVMVHRRNIRMIDAAEPVSQIYLQMLDMPHTRIPLWKDEQENIVGILHAKDLLRAVIEADGNLDAIDIMDLARPPWFVPETTGLQEQLNAFLRKGSHFALVVDEYGALMGLVTLEDILEEIVGEIYDEHDQTLEGVRPQPQGTVNVDGWVTIRDLNRAMDWQFPDEEATTIAGLIIHEAKAIPEQGQVFSFYGFKFEILRRQRNQITAIRVTPPADTDIAPDADLTRLTGPGG
ncbi:MAG: HlyC/CorC family transporter [Pseudomonadota bacterium]